MTIESQNNLPFKDDLKPHSFNTIFPYEHIRELQGNPAKLVRLEQSRKIGKEEQLQDRLEKFGIAKKLLAEIQNDYGIEVPTFDFVVARNPEEGRPEIYTVYDKIEGICIGDDLHEIAGRVPQSEIEKVCISLINYFSDKYKKGGYFLSDIVLVDQFVYGHKYGEKINKMYLIDVEPLFDYYNADTRKFNLDLYHQLINFPDFIRSCELLSSDMKLQKVRERFREFYGSISPRDSMHKMKSFESLKTFD